jgi:hypothetical protein
MNSQDRTDDCRGGPLPQAPSDRSGSAAAPAIVTPELPSRGRGNGEAGAIVRRPHSKRWHSIAPGVIGVACVVAGFVVWSLAKFGSVEDGWYYLQGKQIFASPRIVHIGTVPTGSARTVSVRLINLSTSSYDIIGAMTSCTCVATEGLPAALDAGSYRDLRITVRGDAAPGTPVEQTVTYATNNPDQPHVSVLLRGHMSSP